MCKATGGFIFLVKLEETLPKYPCPHVFGCLLFYSGLHSVSLFLASPYWISHYCQIVSLCCHSLAITVAKFLVCVSAAANFQLDNLYLL